MKILLVDDHLLFRDGLVNLFTAYDIEIAGTAADGLEALQKMRSLQADVILMDIYMPRCNGLEAVKLIKTEFPSVKIVMLTASEEDENLFEAIRNGACGYLLKKLQAEELLAMIKELEQGEPPLAPGMAMKIMNEFGKHPKPQKDSFVKSATIDNLTMRQMSILGLLAEGKRYRQIAAELYFSERTIKYEVKRILEQLHLTSRLDAIAYVNRIRLIDEKANKEENSQK